MLRDGAKKHSFRNWLQGLERNYAARLLPIDVEISHIWGEITASARSKDHTLAAADGLIAATALRHGLYVMTRNVADFEPTNALLINPFV